MSFVVFNQNLQTTKRMSLDKILFSSHAVGIIHFIGIASFRDILWEMVTLIILTKWQKQKILDKNLTLNIRNVF